MAEWIGVDLDGTAAFYGDWNGDIGSPIEPMIQRIKEWRKKGIEVRIFTARVGKCKSRSPESGQLGNKKFIDEQRKMIEDWCLRHIGEVLPVTATKDFEMKLLYDDRAIRITKNSGFVCEGCQRSL